MKYKTILKKEATSSANGTNSTTKKTTAAPSVSFGPVHVREHERVLLEGTGLGMSWTYLPCRMFSSIEEHYDERTKRWLATPPKITTLRISAVEERMKLLCDYGFTEQEIHNANREERNRRLRAEYMRYKERGERSSLRDLVESIKSFGSKLASSTSDKNKKKRKRRKKRSQCTPLLQ